MKAIDVIEKEIIQRIKWDLLLHEEQEEAIELLMCLLINRNIPLTEDNCVYIVTQYAERYISAHGSEGIDYHYLLSFAWDMSDQYEEKKQNLVNVNMKFDDYNYSLN